MNKLMILMLVAVLAPCAEAVEQQVLVETSRDGHIQTVSSIRQLECRMELKIAPITKTNPYTGKVQTQPPQIQQFSWWEDQGVARCVQRVNGPPEIVQEFLWKDGVLKFLKTAQSTEAGREPARVGRYDGPAGLRRVPTIWRSALFYRADELRDLLTAQKVVSATEDMVGGRRLYKITVNTNDVYREEIFFDPRRNFAVQKIVGYSDLNDPTAYHVSEVTAFTEPKPGIFFPATVNQSYFEKGKSEHRSTATFTSVRINDGVDSSKLQLTFPAGTEVSDNRTGKAYTTGADELPVGPEEAIAKPHESGENKQYPTAMQQRSAWPLILVAMAICVVIGLVASAVARRRRPTT